MLCIFKSITCDTYLQFIIIDITLNISLHCILLLRGLFVPSTTFNNLLFYFPNRILIILFSLVRDISVFRFSIHSCRRWCCWCKKICWTIFGNVSLLWRKMSAVLLLHLWYRLKQSNFKHCNVERTRYRSS